jgi:hypothetical protein
MKTTILFILLSCKSVFHTQENNIEIGLPYSETIYTGYENLIKISYCNKILKNVTLYCEECDSIRAREKNSNEWLLRTNKVGEVNVIAKNKKGKEIGSKKFYVKEPPPPIVYIDSIDAQSIITKSPSEVNLKLHSSIPLTLFFTVKIWTIQIGDKTFTGYGKKLSKELNALMEKEKSGVLILKLEYFSPSGVHEIKEIFQFSIV